MLDEVTTMKRRPGPVVVVTTFIFFAAAVALLTGVSLLFPNPIWSRLWDLNRPAYIAFERFGRTAGIPLLALGVVTGIAGTCLIKGKKWAWWFAISLFAINGLGDLVALLLTRDLVKGGSGVLIAVAFLFYLTRPNVNRYFREGV
jgi:hypothetical protein